ncbi:MULTISPECIES: F0F1 ATP synthase subunit delta [Bacillus]|uniref:F0F1 ATP synthase subunit delta n=1 Tax=Bacillus TaxID=1386 RepID=UPI000BB839E5|nr:MULTISPECIES: F0F1 ATP synthase subunit delta [Bacillus]
MSKNVGVAKRYALALFQLAKENNLLMELDTQLVEVKKVFQTNKDLQLVLSNPKITKDVKKQLIREAFAGLSTPLVNTLQLLVDRGRTAIVVDMVNEYKALSNEAKNVEDAIVYSVRSLSEQEMNTISTVFAAKVGKSALTIENIVDPTIIGGLKIRIGNRIYDGSVSGKLERLGRQLTFNR